NAEQQAQRQNAAFDADRLRVRYAVVNEGPTLKRYTQAAMGRATPILKRTSHVEIHVAGEDAPIAPPVRAGTAEAKAGAKAEAIARPVRAGSGGRRGPNEPRPRRPASPRRRRSRRKRRDKWARKRIPTGSGWESSSSGARATTRAATFRSSSRKTS